MAEAMQKIREELGDDAIIVSTQRSSGNRGVRITAAQDLGESDKFISEILAQTSHTPTADIVRNRFLKHGVPDRLIDKLMNLIQSSPIDDPLAACRFALGTAFSFHPLPDDTSLKPFILIGSHGTGKTSTIAKLAARSTLKHKKVGVISVDNIKASANAQLSAFTDILKIHLNIARGPESLRKIVLKEQKKSDIIFIDSPGLNPFKDSDLDYLKSLIEAIDAEPILVLAAGGDAHEAAEIGEAFSLIGATRLLITRLDTTRRMGAVLAAADKGQMMFCDICASPRIVQGIYPVSSSLMARLLLPGTMNHLDIDKNTTSLED
jgi:flagellar biosynthesis protein FlhF